MFSIQDQEELKKLPAEYDYFESEEVVEQPIKKEIVKIAKQAIHLTVHDLYIYRQKCEWEKWKLEQMKGKLEEDLQKQKDRLNPYNEEFGCDFEKVWEWGDFTYIASFLDAPYMMKIIEAIDVCRHIIGLTARIDQLQKDITTYDEEKARYDAEIEAINNALNIEHLERQYQIQLIADQWVKL